MLCRSRIAIYFCYKYLSIVNLCRCCFAPYQVLKKCGIKGPMPIPIVGNYAIFKMVSQLLLLLLVESD